MATYDFNAFYFATDDLTGEIDTFNAATVTLVVAPKTTSFTYAYDTAQQSGTPTTIEVDPTNIYGLLFDDQIIDPADREAHVLKVTWGSASSPNVSYVLTVDITTGAGGQYAVVLGGAPISVSSVSSMVAFNNSIISAVDVPATSSFAAGKAISFSALPDGYTVGDDDEIFGTNDDNHFQGGNGDDSFHASTGNDTIDGGNDSDTVFYEGLSTGVSINLSNTTSNGVTRGTAQKGATGGTDTLIEIENVHGSHHDDLIMLDYSGYTFDRGGNDTVIGGAGDNRFNAGSGNDSYAGGSGTDEISYRDDGYDSAGAAAGGITVTMTGQNAGTIVDAWVGNDTISSIERVLGSALADTMTGGAGNDFFWGDDGDDVLSGGTGQDTLLGGNGNDSLNPGNSDNFNVIVAGAGDDTVDFTGITAQYFNPALYHYDLPQGINAAVDGAANTASIDKNGAGITTIVNVRAALQGDGLTLNGTSYDDLFNIDLTSGDWVGVEGERGNDTINIGAGNGTVRIDYMDSSATSGVLANLTSGIVANDGLGYIDQINIDVGARLVEIRGTDLDDSIMGSAGSDRFITEQGDDTIDGSDGWDTVRYNRSGVGAVTVDLGAGTATGTWDGVVFFDTLRNIEAVSGSRDDDDLLIGDDNDNYLAGEGGNDTLIGNGGDDSFEDLDGDNSISGGSGEDYATIGRGNSTVDGGADYDTVEIVDDTSEALVINFTDGVNGDQPRIIGRSDHSASATVYYAATLNNIERIAVDFEGDLLVLGDDNDNTIDLLADMSTLTFHGGGGTDQLQMHRLTMEGDTTSGVTLDEFLTSGMGLEYDSSTGDLRMTNAEGSTVALLSGVEEIRFADQTMTIAQVVSAAGGGGPTNADDDLTGTDDNDTIDAQDGNDTVTGLDGDDKLIGGNGNDSLSGGDGNDTLQGGAGDDTLDASGGSASTNYFGDYVMPGTGSNTIIGHELLFETDGIDIGYQDVTGSGGLTITVGENGTGTTTSAVAGVVNDTFTYAHRFDGSPDGDTFNGSDNSQWEGWGGGAGNDTINGGGGYDELLYHQDASNGGTGAIAINFDTGTAIDPFGNVDIFTGIEAVRGTALADSMVGSAALSFLSYRGLDGNDTITGSSAWDRIDYSVDGGYGGTAGIIADLTAGTVQDGFGATDTVSQIDGVRGTDANDKIIGAGLAEFLSGRDGDDTLNGNAGNDTLNGGDGADTLIGGDGDDFIFGGDSAADLRDIVYGGNGNDSIDGGYGNDELRGDAGDDSIEGGYGVDTVIGGDGNDVLTGSAWSDLIFGGNGNDFINGGFGFDRVNGGAGADKFFHTGNAGHGSDWIQDYDAAQGDVLFYGAAATKSDFLVQRATTASAGADTVQEVFITHKTTGVLLWALVDGDAQTSLNVQAAGQVFDLLA
ncbi:beta strand repeat-containing protein [Pseudoprimorskyibacter insulae]|uniref:Bifunctional hemolysin/adenylate cyclase n=1 Tax=Pseudoprimorskyibacter insulae TaxID=1695997 RepID=A0A2R8B0J4_9RHOB|nr:calcium-binding protein [Pseudoprimorskyibacter insulae]SPF81808.1 Bifunctional hemolysin/adenylate cyclase [Pseudoprimorskyibacter insulae]